MRPVLSLVVCGFLVVTAGCRPRLLQLLDSPSFTARDVLDDVRQAHSGGRRVLSMQFMSEETFAPSTSEIFYPELAPGFVARSLYDFEHRTAWQQAVKGRHGYLWNWDGHALTTSRDGAPYRPILGVDRSLHLRALLVLLQPAEAISRSGAELVRVADRAGHPCISARGVDTTIPDMMLEVDPETSLVDAVEYRDADLPRFARLRAELSDYRDVDGVMIPHRIVLTVPTSGAGLEINTLTLWDVEVDVASAYPSPMEPR